MKTISASILLILVIIVHVYILGKLQFAPYPELFIFPYLTNQGLIPYLQINDQHFPGLFFLPINFATLGLVDEASARLWQYGIVFMTHVLIFVLTRSITHGLKKPLLANLLFFILHPLWGGTSFNVESLVPLFMLPVFYLFYLLISSIPSRKQVFLMGLLMSFAIIFRQTYFALAAIVMLAVFYSTNGVTSMKKRILVVFYFLAGLLPLLVVVGYYFYSLGVMEQFFYWTIKFNFDTYLPLSRKLPESPSYAEMALTFSPFLFFVLIKNKKLVLSLLIFGIFFLLGVSDRWDFVHFQPVLPFLAIGMSVLFIEKYKSKVISSLISLYLILSALMVMIFLNNNISSSVWFFDQETMNLSEKIKSHTKPGDEILLFGPVPILYTFSQTLPPGNNFYFQLPWYMAVRESAEIANLKENKPDLILRDKTISVDGRSILDFSSNLNQYIDQNYLVFEKINNVELMRKID